MFCPAVKKKLRITVSNQPMRQDAKPNAHLSMPAVFNLNLELLPSDSYVVFSKDKKTIIGKYPTLTELAKLNKISLDKASRYLNKEHLVSIPAFGTDISKNIFALLRRNRSTTALPRLRSIESSILKTIPVKRINNNKFYFYICCNPILQQKNSNIFSLRNESVLSFDLLNNLLVRRTEGESMLILKQLDMIY